MPTIRDQAHLIVDGIRAETAGKTDVAARTVWEYYNRMVKEKKYNARVEGFLGHKIDLSMSKVIRKLWPEFDHFDEATKEALKLFSTNLSAHLRDRGNLRLIERGMYKGNTVVVPTTWYVSNEWSDKRRTEKVEHEPQVVRSKVKVTKEEAGETRAAGPVTIMYACRFGCGYKSDRNWNREQHEKHCKLRPPEVVAAAKEKKAAPAATMSAPLDGISEALNTLSMYVMQTKLMWEEIERLRGIEKKYQAIVALATPEK